MKIVDIMDQLDALEHKINSALGTSHTPGTESCHYWTGAGSVGADGWNSFRTQHHGMIRARTKEELLVKMQEFYNEHCLNHTTRG